MLFLSREIRIYIKSVDYKYFHHIKLTFENNLSITGVYWKRSINNEELLKSIKDIYNTGILVGDVNFTIKELDQDTNNNNGNNFKKFLNDKYLLRKNDQHEYNKLDHIFVNTKYIDLITYDYHKFDSDHPLIEVNLKYIYDKDKSNTDAEKNKSFTAFDYKKLKTMKSLATNKIYQDLYDFVKRADYFKIITQSNLYDEHLINILISF